MSRPTIQPTGREISFGEDEIIVSKTDPRGVITYANDVFLRVAGYDKDELLGQPHNCIRHPAMPRCVFQLLWEVVKGGEEIFAYVLNLAKNGDAYWVFAHVTPSFGAGGEIVGYHSNRRLPHADALQQVRPLYAALLAEEARHGNKDAGMRAARQMLEDQLARAGLSYGEFVFSLSASTRLEHSLV
ncbi:MAG: PAS domain-containing protein [Verrucomicrobiota bacterium]